MSIDANPEQPAFPSGDGPYGGGPNHAYGMTLRDWFAGQVIGAVVMAYVEANGRVLGTDHIASNCPAHAYRIADAMLKARES